MALKMTALELIFHLADGSTTPNTLPYIANIARGELDALKEQEELQPFKDMADKSYFRGVRDGQKLAQRKPLTSKNTTFAQRFTNAVAILCGAEPPTEFVDEWLGNVDVNGVHRLQEWVLNQAATPPWAQGIVVLDAAHLLAESPEEGEQHKERPKPTNEQLDAEFDAYAAQFDTLGDEWQDMGAGDYFKAGFMAAHNNKGAA